MGLDVTLYGYVVNLNEHASHNSSGCGTYMTSGFGALYLIQGYTLGYYVSI